MNPISLVLNILWIVTGGIWAALGWLVAAVLMALTIVGIPWARAAVTIASYSLLPFGRRAVPRDEFRGREDIGTGALGWIGNLVWLVLAGWWLALMHLGLAIALALTLIGIPFAWAHLKLAALSLWPIGREIVTDEEYAARFAAYR
ncbi:YccF domain-containing protein [Arenibaculum pallidiluteum]|uniref:YccF domain-containing protein n=1 Tax=Arenibaculum pallidiluteum TaxID=2812559 RepID=UPI001A979BC3|nr:YccF domain-containing protein [Arenibaculum pallidiluteum]